MWFSRLLSPARPLERPDSAGAAAIAASSRLSGRALLTRWVGASKARPQPRLKSGETFEVGNRIREGAYYAYHEIAGEPNLIGRVALPARTKRYWFGVTVRYPMPLYTRLKFGIRDIVEHEYRAFQSLPAELHDYLPRQVRLGRTPSGQPILCTERVSNFDGTPARSLQRTGPVANHLFWEEVDRIVEILCSRQSFLLGVFHSGTHVAVQKRSPTEWRPVITHALKLGRAMYRPQFYLLSPTLLRWKFERGYRRLRERFMA